MPKINIKFIVLGNLKFNVQISKIKKWKSFCFEISEPNFRGLLPNAEGPDWVYTDLQLARLIQHDPAYDLTFAVGNFPLEDNFYLRRIADNVAVLSLYETGDILRDAELELEYFILRNIYEIVLVFYQFERKVPPAAYAVAHDEIRGCLFDMNAYKPDIVYSTEKVNLCNACKLQIERLALPENFLRHLEKELRRIRKGLFYRLLTWVKANPILSIVITTISALLIDVLSHYIWDLIKCK